MLERIWALPKKVIIPGGMVIVGALALVASAFAMVGNGIDTKIGEPIFFIGLTVCVVGACCLCCIALRDRRQFILLSAIEGEEIEIDPRSSARQSRLSHELSSSMILVTEEPAADLNTDHIDHSDHSDHSDIVKEALLLAQPVAIVFSSPQLNNQLVGAAGQVVTVLDPSIQVNSTGTGCRI